MTQQEQTNQPAPPPNPPSTEAEPQVTQAPANQPLPKKKKRKKKKTSSPPATSAEGPTKTVVRNGSTAEPEVKFSPGSTSTDQQNRQRGKVNYLLTSTDDNLKKLSNRQLNSTQQDAVQQIRTYMEQAKAALTEGDLQRGENLATKARLLSDDLLKQ